MTTGVKLQIYVGVSTAQRARYCETKLFNQNIYPRFVQ